MLASPKLVSELLTLKLKSESPQFADVIVEYRPNLKRFRIFAQSKKLVFNVPPMHPEFEKCWSRALRYLHEIRVGLTSASAVSELETQTQTQN